MFLGIVASAGLFLGGLTTAALLCSNVTAPQTIPFTQKAPVAPSGALEQVLLSLSSGGRELFIRNQTCISQQLLH